MPVKYIKKTTLKSECRALIGSRKWEKLAKQLYARIVFALPVPDSNTHPKAIRRDSVSFTWSCQQHSPQSYTQG